MTLSINRRSAGKKNPFGQAAKLGRVTLTVGTEAADVITVAVQAQNPNGQNVAERVHFDWYLSTDAEGDNVTSSAATGGVAAGSNGVVGSVVTGKAGFAITNASGAVDIAITDSGAPTFYLIVRMPDGSLVASGAITFV